MDKNKKPLSFSTIIVYKDSIALKATIADSLGKYVINNVPTGIYKFSFSTIGMKKYDENITLSQDSVLNAILEYDNTVLEEVVVIGRLKFQRKADRFIYNVENSEITKGISMLETLKQTPLLNVNEDAVSIVGKSNTDIYINGRRSNLSYSSIINLLKNTASENIKSIEIITVPSSNFDVKGNTGIINIALRNYSEYEGFKGYARLSDRQAFYNNQFGSLDLNFHKNKIGISLNTWLNLMKQMNFTDGTFEYKTQNSRQDFSQYNRSPKDFYGVNLGVDYAINTKKTIGIKAIFNGRNQPNQENYTFNKYTNGSNEETFAQSLNIQNSSGYDISLNGNYKVNIDSLGRYFNIDLDYLNYFEDRTNDFFTYSSNSNSEYVRLLQKINQKNPQDVDNLSSRIDYLIPFNTKDNISFGSNVAFTNAKNDSYFGNFENNQFQRNNSKSFLYQYKEFIGAFFSNYSKTWSKKIQSVVGFRLENTINSGSIDNIKNFTNNYWNLLPYISLSMTPEEKHQISYTFSSRISRPDFWELNPFINNISQNVFSQNNPFLQPSRSYINEVSYTFNSRYTMIANYTNTQNDYSQFQLSADPQSNSVKFLRLNYGYNNKFSLTTSTYQSFFSGFWDINAMLSFSYTNYSGQVEYLKINSEGNNFILSLNNTLSISKKKKWYLYTMYICSSPSPLPNGQLSSIEKLDIGIKKRWKEWTFDLWGNDIFKSTYQRYSLEDIYLKTVVSQYNDIRALYFSIAYSFGNQKLKTNRYRQTANEDISDRVKR